MDTSTVVLISVMVGYAAWFMLIKRWYKLASDNYHAGNYSEAAKAYSRILFVQRSNFHAYHWRAECNLKLEKFEEAIVDYDKMIHIKSSNIPAYLDRSRAFAIQNNFEKAHQDIDQALRLDPENSRAFLLRGSLYRQQNEPDQSITAYSKAIELLETELQRAKQGMPYSSSKEHIIFLENNLGWVYRHRGDVFFQNKDLDGALSDYEWCIRANYNLEESHLARAMALHRKEDRAAAFAAYNQVLELNPDNVSAWLYRGIVNLETGQTSDAVNDFSQAIRLDDQQWILFNNRAEGYFALQEYDKALLDLQKADEISPGEKMVQAAFAITYHVTGKIDEAQKIWQALIEAEPRYKDVDWVQKNLNWQAPLAEEARKLIAALDSK